MKKVLINRTDAIGDTVLTSSMASAIKETYPDAHITFLISPIIRPFFDHHPHVDHVEVIDKKKSKVLLFRTLWQIFKNGEFDSYFYVGGTHLPSIVARLIGVKSRGGLKSRLTSFFTLNKGVRQSRALALMHETEYNLDLLAPFGIDWDFRHLDRWRPQIQFHDGEVDHEIERLKDEFPNLYRAIENKKKLIVIHPGMTGHTLNWPSEKYGRLLSKLFEENPSDYFFLLSMTPSDQKYVDEMLEQFKESVPGESWCLFDGTKLGLRNWMATISKASLFVGPSTGTTHLANTLDTPLLTFYSPIKVQSAKRWGPYKWSGSRQKVLIPDVVCGQNKICAGESCPYHECMPRLEVAQAFQAARQLLNN